MASVNAQSPVLLLMLLVIARCQREKVSVVQKVVLVEDTQ